MEDYFNSEEFKCILKKYEDMLQYKIGEFLDSEELDDIAEYYISIEEFDKAKEALDFALEIFPDSVPLLYNLARMIVYQEGNIDKAYALAEQMNDKTDFNYFSLIAELKCLEKKEDEANGLLKNHLSELKYYEDESTEEYILDCAKLFVYFDYPEIAKEWLEMYEDKDNSEYKEVLGQLYTILGNYDASNKILNNLLDEEPHSHEYWDQLADNNFQQGDLEGALSASEYSIAINPNNQHAILNKANALFALGNSNEALEFYENYLNLCREDEKSIVYISMGHIELGEGNFDLASKYFADGIDTATCREIAYIQVAIAGFDNGLIGFAYKLLRENLPQTPKEWKQGYAVFARCCFELNKMDEYNRSLPEAISMDKEECKETLSELYPNDCKPIDYMKYQPNEEKRRTDLTTNWDSFFNK